MAVRLLKPLIPSFTSDSLSRHSHSSVLPLTLPFLKQSPVRKLHSTKMSATAGADDKPMQPKSLTPTFTYGHLLRRLLISIRTFLNMEDAGVDGALIVQPINHRFDHSLVASALKKYPTKFVGCCLANPAEDGSGVKHLEQLVLEDGFRAVRFNPFLWPSGEKMTNNVGKALFSRAGELGIPVGFMCFKGLDLHLAEIQELCTEFPSTTVLLDHFGFCKPPINDEESFLFSELLKLSKFQQVYIKFSALFRVSRMPFPYQDLSPLLSQVVSRYGANRVMWGSDFPFVVPECGYDGGKEAATSVAEQASLSSSEIEGIMGKTVMQLFPGQWLP